MSSPEDTPTVIDFLEIRGGETADVFAFEALDTDGAAIDLTGFEARMEIRDPTTEDNDLVLALDTGDGSLVNGGTDGTLVGAVTSSIANAPGAFRYELWVKDTLNSTHPWWIGRVVVSESAMSELP